ncbi:hypothetical protein [Campylobacter rectus]|uniref:hypothetical protein n=1 Tax=Campylobacter rectus TaxID=203 RepID=UPI000F5F3EAD|nr:hypothetical protein [Campylobacter rectus]RRD53589.1 hypothetical protein EII16_08595 [Campylobacter rectus]
MKTNDAISKSLQKILSNPENLKLLGSGNNTIVNGNSNVVVLGNLSINAKKEAPKPPVICPPGSISEEQIRSIDDLIKEIAEIEAQAGVELGKAIAKWKAVYKKKFKLLSYRCLPLEKFDDVMSWLRQTRARLQPKLRRRNNDEWRLNKYKGIFARGKELGFTKEQITQMAGKKFNKDIKSIKELGEQNLEKFYRYIFSL